MKFYTGVGSRKTPKPILKIMENLARKLSKDEWILRSGGAAGADSAFQVGAGSCSYQIFRAGDATTEALDIAKKFHPAWDRCSDYAKRLHGRNAFQVLGQDLKTPSTFLICWTPDGAKTHAERTIRTGGTGTAISIADHYKVPVFNLRNYGDLVRVERFLNI